MATEPNIGAVKICGYLEKKGKMKVVTTWKKYWFVLEGRLLLYYRSQEEYENLSPCKGSINMGLAVNIRPGLAAAGILEIITRTSTITLRAKHRAVQEKWLQALLDASGQQSASSPVVKMTHFRYSMDNLIPAPTTTLAKAAVLLTRRQNTLPYRFNKTKLVTDYRHKEIVERLQQIGARSYGGSLDSIVRKKTKTAGDGDGGAKMSRDEKLQENDLYDVNQVFMENTEYISSSDENKNHVVLVENDEYLKCDEMSKSDENDAEYYCTYFEPPDLPPRKGGESDDEITKKQSAFSKFARKFRNFTSMTKNTRKKSGDENNAEPIYDTVNYCEINTAAENVQDVAQVQAEIQAEVQAENIVKTLLDLKQTLEEKKLKVKDILESNGSSPPGLPPRTGSKTFQRSASPFHDTPKNNSPVTPPPTIDKILNDLELDQENEELNVRQLIKKFNNNPEDVNLRQKNTEDEDVVINRYSEDLNKLLEELTKVTSAPLLTPGVTSSLIQMRGPPVTDEEWLAVTPIRRRRFSDPDYDVPRPHRSLQFLTPATGEDTRDEEAIPATRFFGPVLSPPGLTTETWRSMTPDSLEPTTTTAVQSAASRRPTHDSVKMAPDFLAFMDSLEPLSEGATAF